MRTIIFVFAVLILMGCIHSAVMDESIENGDEMLALAKEVALKFNYYNEISLTVPNFCKGGSEIGGQCGDYALEFVNLWNSRYPDKALLVIQQQGIEQFPDGIYEVVGKDTQDLPFMKDRTTSMLYVWNNVSGIGHPESGGYEIRLIKEVYVKTHFGLGGWSTNGPHIWVVIGDVAVDPTYADFGTRPIVGYDTYQ